MDDFNRVLGGKLRIFHQDLKAAGVIKSRTHQHELIRSGRLPPPHKPGGREQSRAFWYPTEVQQFLIAEQQRIKDMEAALSRGRPRKANQSELEAPK
jgi:hypothetical protein